MRTPETTGFQLLQTYQQLKYELSESIVCNHFLEPPRAQCILLGEECFQAK